MITHRSSTWLCLLMALAFVLFGYSPADGKKKIKFPPGAFKGLVPIVTGIFTTPKALAVTPKGTLFINGKNFGTGIRQFSSTEGGKVMLKFRLPMKHFVTLSVVKWTNTNIVAKIPGNISGVKDHKVRLYVRRPKGLWDKHYTVPFYATRETKYLAQSDPAVKVVQCSVEGDTNVCNGLDVSTGGCSPFAVGPLPPVEQPATISAFHENCELIVDWDKGTDKYAITLKNGWVINKIQPGEKGDGWNDQTLRTMEEIQQIFSAPGKPSWNPHIRWQVSPGPGDLHYWYKIWIEGPKGVPHF